MSEIAGMARRAFMKRAAGTMVAASVPTRSEAVSPPQTNGSPRIVEVGAPNCMAPYTRPGQPFELPGNRLIFTSYQYIQPASKPLWYSNGADALTSRAGELPESVAGTAGMWDAHLKTTNAPIGIRLAVQPARRSDKPHKLQPIKPWEDGGVELTDLIVDDYMEIHWAGNMIFDEEDGYYKVWGNCSSKGIPYRCYFQSRDFQTWERPSLGVMEYEGSKTNNLIQPKKGTLFGFIFKDPSSREERWKWIQQWVATQEQYEEYRKKRPKDWDPLSVRMKVSHGQSAYRIRAVVGGVSPDGFRWTTLREPLVIHHADDPLHTAYYDFILKRYVHYFREYMMPTYSARYAGDDRGLSWTAGRRAIARAETDDFRKFPLPEMIMEPSPNIVGPSDTFYTNCHTFVPGAKDQHLFFPTIWHQFNDSTSVAAFSSSDGRILHWLPGENPVLTTADFGEWDGGCLFAQPDLMELPNGDWILPYIGFNVPHKYPRRGGFKYGLGFGCWPRGRLVAVAAPERGQFTTYALMPPGRKIRLNAVTTRGGGSVLVEVADLAGKAVSGRSFEDCNPLVGDQHKALVTWKGGEDVGLGDGKPISLRFRMEQAKLFFVDFEG